jgi:flagellar assembly protein FliH
LSIDAAFSPYTFPALPGEPADEQASIRGHAAGYAAGRRQVEQELETLRVSIELDGTRRARQGSEEVQLALDALARSAAEYRQRELPVLRAVESAIANAAIELAEAIIGRELSTTDSSARAALERAVHEAGSTGSAIRLNPEDIAVISADARLEPGIDLIPDASIERGDAVIDVANGSIDARISTSLARVRAALQDGAR